MMERWVVGFFSTIILCPGTSTLIGKLPQRKTKKEFGKSLNIVKYQADLLVSELRAASTPNQDIDKMVHTYDSVVTRILDVHAPASELTRRKRFSDPRNEERRTVGSLERP